MCFNRKWDSVQFKLFDILNGSLGADELQRVKLISGANATLDKWWLKPKSLQIIEYLASGEMGGC